MNNTKLMNETTKVLMNYLYRHERKEKCVTLENVLDWTREGKYRHKAVEKLPKVMPAIGEKGSYTGLVLLSFRIEEGIETLERLRKVVNLWEQTLMSFVGTSGQSLKVLIPYRSNSYQDF